MCLLQVPISPILSTNNEKKQPSPRENSHTCMPTTMYLVLPKFSEQRCVIIAPDHDLIGDISTGALAKDTGFMTICRISLGKMALLFSLCYNINVLANVW